MKNNKKGILATTLVTVIVFAVIFVVVLRFYSAILAIIKALGEDYFWCLLKKVISAYTKIWPVGVQVWGAFCPPVVKTITLLDEGENTIPIDVSLTKRELENLKKWYPGEDFEKEGWYRKYRLDQAIAKEMKRCWGRNGEGELPLGPEWGDKFKDKLDPSIFYCDLCIVYKFDKRVQEKFFGKELELNEFLHRNPIRPGSSLSYWEYLKDKDYSSDLFKTMKYSTDKDLAIIYIRKNPNKLIEVLRDVFVDPLPLYGEEDHPIPTDFVVLRPFEEFETLGCRT